MVALLRTLRWCSKLCDPRAARIGAPMTDSAAKKVLLLVDDDPANIHVVHSILKEDYDVRVATNGVKALQLAKGKTPPDLVLLDVSMPNMDGYEVCAHLKADEIAREIPVIFLTGKTEVVDETRGFEVGAVDYIHKPFSPQSYRRASKPISCFAQPRNS